MKIIATRIPDVKIIEPAVFGDPRGFFMESWSKKKMEELGLLEKLLIAMATQILLLCPML